MRCGNVWYAANVRISLGQVLVTHVPEWNNQRVSVLDNHEDDLPDGSVSRSHPSIIDSRFAVVRQLGKGGHASVYLVRDLTGNGLRVLKVARDQQSAAAEVVCDAETSRLLAGPGVRVVYETGYLSDGRAFALIEYVEGVSVQSMLRETPLSPEDALTVAIAVGRTLVRVHDMHMVHRDVKPLNMIVPVNTDEPEFERTVLIDFGIARRAVDSSMRGPAKLTLGQLSATHEYSAPEQLAGRRPDPKMDVYALGSSLFGMLYGHPPFMGGAAGRAMAPLKGMPRPYMGSFILRRLTEEISLPDEPTVPHASNSSVKQSLRVGRSYNR
jgi:serine/threonine protein kinase